MTFVQMTLNKLPRKFAAAMFVAAAAMWGSGPATAQTVCPKCGQIHAVTSSPITSPQATSLPGSYVANRPVTSPVPMPAVTNRPRPVARGVSNVLSTLNAQRSRQGIGTLQFDPALQAVAQQRAQQMASMGIKSHPPGSFAPGRYEGVGWSSSYTPGAVMACYTSDPNMRVAGAAMATGRDGVYFAVVYR